MGQLTLRITILESDAAIAIKLEGRIAGPWVAELDRVWIEIAPRRASKELSLDLSGVTYADGCGKQVLRKIYAQTQAILVSSSPWTQFLAEEVAANVTAAFEPDRFQTDPTQGDCTCGNQQRS